MNSNQIALTGICLVTLIFAIVAFFNAKIYTSRSDFLFAERISKDNLAVNISATFSSLAGPFFFFMLQAANFGYMLIILLFAQYYGHKYFVKLVSGIDLKPEHSGSIYRIVRYFSGSDNIAFASNLIVIINTFFLLSIELILGSAVFLYFAGNIDNIELVAFIAIISLVTTYIVSGGFKLVFLTDRWQYALISTGIFTCLLVVVVSSITKLGLDGTSQALWELMRHPLLPGLALFVFFLNTLATTFTQACVQVSSWQRIAAAENFEAIRAGVDRAIKRQFLLVWFAAILIGAISRGFGESITDVADIANLIKSIGIVGEFIVFPLLFLGLYAALISTADSHLISLMLSIDDSIGGWFNKLRLHNVRGGVQIWFSGIALFIAMLLIGEFLWFQNLSTDWRTKITQLMFAGYGQAGLLFPIIFLFVSRVRRNREREEFEVTERQNNCVAGIILFALVLYWGLHWHAMQENKFLLSQLTPVIALLVTGTSLLVIRSPKVASSS